MITRERVSCLSNFPDYQDGSLVNEIAPLRSSPPHPLQPLFKNKKQHKYFMLSKAESHYHSFLSFKVLIAWLVPRSYLVKSPDQTEKLPF